MGTWFHLAVVVEEHLTVSHLFFTTLGLEWSLSDTRGLQMTSSGKRAETLQIRRCVFSSAGRNVENDPHSLIKKGDLKSRKGRIPHRNPIWLFYQKTCTDGRVLVLWWCRCMQSVLDYEIACCNDQKKKRAALAATSLPVVVVWQLSFILLRTPRCICLYLELAEDSRTSHRTESRSQSDRTGRVTGASVGLCVSVSPVCTLMETRVETVRSNRYNLVLWTYLKGTSLQGMAQE